MPSHDPSPHGMLSRDPASRGARAARFAAALATIAIVWLGVLPWVAQQPVVREHIERQERANIDPSAMFYSELDIALPIAHRVERMREADPDAFWKWSE